MCFFFPLLNENIYYVHSVCWYILSADDISLNASISIEGKCDIFGKLVCIVVSYYILLSCIVLAYIIAWFFCCDRLWLSAIFSDLFWKGTIFLYIIYILAFFLCFLVFFSLWTELKSIKMIHRFFSFLNGWFKVVIVINFFDFYYYFAVTDGHTHSQCHRQKKSWTACWKEWEATAENRCCAHHWYHP